VSDRGEKLSFFRGAKKRKTYGERLFPRGDGWGRKKQKAFSSAYRKGREDPRKSNASGLRKEGDGIAEHSLAAEITAGERKDGSASGWPRAGGPRKAAPLLGRPSEPVNDPHLWAPKGGRGGEKGDKPLRR